MAFDPSETLGSVERRALLRRGQRFGFYRLRVAVAVHGSVQRSEVVKRPRAAHIAREASAVCLSSAVKRRSSPSPLG